MACADREKLRKTACVALIVVATAFVYVATLKNGFVYDDNKILLANPWITDYRRIFDVMTSSLMSFGPGSPTSNTYRPVVFILWMLLYHAAGFTAWVFHLANVVMHATNAVLVFAIGRLFFSNKHGNGPVRAQASPLLSMAPALFAALVFSLHTVNTEVVNWVSAQVELSFTFFVLLAFYLYARPSRARHGRGAGWALGPAVLFFLALLCKETAVAFIPVALAFDLSSQGLSGLKKRSKAYAAFFLAAALYMALRLNAIGGVMHHRQIDLSAYRTAINVFPLLFKYMYKLVWPAGLNALYVFYPVHSITSALALAGIGVLLALAAAFVVFRRSETVFTSLALLVTPLLPVLYFPALSAAAFADRYMYLPSTGFALLLGVAFNRAFARSGRDGGYGPRAYALVIISVALLGAYSAASVQRSAVWRSDYTLWSDTVKRSPLSANAHYNLAWASEKRGDVTGAVANYRETIRLDPAAADAHYNLGVIYANEQDLDSAAAEFRAALRIDPGYAEARRMLAYVTRLKGL